MHGRPRVKQSDQDPERVKAAQEKAVLLGKLLEQVLNRRKQRQYDAESLALSAKLLELSPEVYTVWNYRREAIEPVLAQGGDDAIEAVNKELDLTQKALMRNPKSYSTWHHRKWIVETGFCSLTKELDLVEMLLNADERNFHGWGYRRFIAQRMGMPAERELEYTRKKIEQNFSNYSAWHYRTYLLPIIYSSSQIETTIETPLSNNSTDDKDSTAATTSIADAAGTASIPLEILAKEYELVKQAFYTEPEDQSGWFYHRWLLGCSIARWQATQQQNTHNSSSPELQQLEKDRLLETIHNEKTMCEELLQVEPDAKWPLLTLTRLQDLQRQIEVGQLDAVGSELASEGVRQAYEKLIDEDSMRKGYYEDAVKGRAHVVTVPKKTLSLGGR